MSFRTVYGNEWSENGWRMCDRNECDIPRIKDLYLVDTAPLRKGAPLVILGAWLKYYDTMIEEITTPVWGWSEKNDVGDSNHLAGTSVDILAPRYPHGRKTMRAEIVDRVRAGQAAFEGSVFHGRDWNYPDEMHYQLAWPEGDKRNDAFAAKLLAGHLGIYAPAPSTPTPADPADDAVWSEIRAQFAGPL